MVTVSSEPGDRTELLRALDDQMRKTSALSVMLSQTVAERVGLNPTDMEAMDLLFLNGAMTAGRLAELTGLTTGAITGIVDRLEDAGHVLRMPDEHDRRRVIIQPQPERAMREIGPLYEPLAERMQELYADYTDAEIATMLDFMTRACDICANHIATLRTIPVRSRRSRGGG